MSKASIDQQIRDRIDLFVTELSALVREAALESVKGALTDEQVGRVRRAPGRPRRLATVGVDGVGRRGSKRTPEMLDQLKENLLEIITLNPGQRMEELGRLLEVPTKELTLPVKKLLADKKVKTKGQKRATTYWAK
jgi:hypothetical protein